VRLGYASAFMTEEFKGQKAGDQFGAITLSLRF
jgi:hypothetical protein